MIKIDGGFGEGGGQILRYAAALAAATGDTVEVYNIRANRPKPGLRPQHYSALKIMKNVFGGDIEGLKVGSKRVIIKLGGPKSATLEFDIGTAGSISLIIQSLTPALILADNSSKIKLIGGTDVKWSPTIDYTAYVYRSILSLFGSQLELKVLRRGYYPRGGGIVSIEISPASKLTGLSLLNRGKIEEILIRSVVSLLPKHIVDRQVDSIIKEITKSNLIKLKETLRIEKEVFEGERAAGPGTSVLMIGKHSFNIYCGGDAIGERGKPAEKVGEEAFHKFMDWYVSKAFLDAHAGDMIIPFLALAIGKSSFTVPRFTKHMESALYVAREILNTNFRKEVYNRAVKIDINP